MTTTACRPLPVNEGADGAVGVQSLDVDTDRERAKESFRRLALPGVTTVCFGHGAPLVGERAGLLRAAANAAEVPDPLGWGRRRMTGAST